ncbi:class C sortase [Streptococcus equi]|uniref:Sortase C family protein SrtC.3 n=1 Tax=Streptococcus equi subsp. equi TaxID=148942 RepID=A0A380JUX5_9STRE|nr:class C sortase [Streptococcus equi]MCD3391865.1 class C sortase [Streptococcus equi subsp. zooepidemicus]SQF06411.1 sortase C family protein SrtC.3 [Streptococcus equi subsp. zooepidemicus]SUN49388.1 sortase C family protein SrtC.3 [Streptococcus equi subsp. equi]HEL0620368.1 class C sortase [Streptococcus equi subsp. zooepidemicus]HEL0625793.1 class C sortase [Streptococcus equi subsp. zooepidemicus]
MRKSLVTLFRIVKENKARVLLFIVGIVIIIFPIVSQVSYYIASHQKINQFERSVSKQDTSEIDQRIALAKAYNETLSKRSLPIDPFTKKQKEGLKEYARMLEIREQIGHVTIPSIGVDIPIYAGTTATMLEKGSGHLEGTSLPIGGRSTHAVLTAHRGLPTARLFTDLNKVKKGDTFYVTNIKETLAYKVDSIRVVDPTALDAVRVVDGKDYVTLLTCTPYMINSHRLLIRGERVLLPSQKVKRASAALVPYYQYYQWLTYLVLVLVVILLMIIFTKYHRRTKQ